MQGKKEENSSEINYEKIIDEGRELVSKMGKYREGEYFINLALLSHNIVETSKITCIGIKQFLNLKLQNENNISIIVKKYYQYFRDKKHKSLSSDAVFSILRGFYRGASIYSENNKYFLSSFCLYKFKQICNELRMKVEQNIESLYTQVMRQISVKLNEKKDEFQTNLTFFEDLRNSIEDINEPNLEVGDIHYVVSSLWLNNLRTFLKNDFSKIERNFDKIGTMMLYYSTEGDEEYQNYLGNYPGPINNFFIMNFKDSWIDPDPNYAYTNVYMRSDIKEKSDFLFISRSLFERLRTYFGCYFEIPRKVVSLFHNNMVEVHLKKFKVLVLTDFLRRDDLRYLMFPKYIQISKLETVADLKKKILRIIKFYNPNFQSTNECRLFLPEYVEPQKQLFDIVYQYSNKFSNSYKIKHEEINDEEMVIDNSKIVPTDILIIEFKEPSQKSYFIQQLSEEKLQCYICESLIEGPVINCDFCKQYFYCSVECKKVDRYHTEYHRNLNQLLKKKIDLEELIKLNLNSLIEKHAKGGLTGLKNLGNTCFMNSALQCLSHTEELTKYFLLKRYVDEINVKNKLGTCGKMAESWHELLRNLWQGNNTYLNPSDFRSIFVKFAHQFAGYSQHDSHEMLAFMLDALHEDLNRVKDKPYIEMQECQEGENEVEASTKWWKNHLRRENSIIVDLFHGQYKSKITCPQCKRISITYDPFMYLGVPIPTGQRMKFKFFSLDNLYNFKEFILPVNESMTVFEVRIKIFENRKALGLNNIDLIEAIAVKDKIFKRVLNGREVVQDWYEKDYEFIFYERESPSSEYLTLYVMPILLNDSETNKYSNRGILYYARPFQIHISNTVKDLYYKIFKFYRLVLEDVDRNRTGEQFVKNMDDRNYVEKEFNLYLEQNKFNSSFIRLNHLYNIPEHESINLGRKIECEHCGSACTSCPFTSEFDVPISKLISVRKYQRPFLLLAEINRKTGIDSKNDIYTIDNNYSNLKKDTISLYDCLDSFSTEEILERENAWYCNRCKEHQLALKKLEIYKAPYILIVQIKRFKSKTNYAALSSLVNRKNDCLVSFPIEDLDLSSYVVGPERNKAQYDLFAVSQHYGSLSGGHYTAMCKNEGAWFKFDDDRVYKESKEKVVSNSAYLLFYRRKYI